jgi:hypothetical protein
VVRACSSVWLSRAAYYRPVEDSTRDLEIVWALNELIGALGHLSPSKFADAGRKAVPEAAELQLKTDC